MHLENLYNMAHTQLADLALLSKSNYCVQLQPKQHMGNEECQSAGGAPVKFQPGVL